MIQMQWRTAEPEDDTLVQMVCDGELRWVVLQYRILNMPFYEDDVHNGDHWSEWRDILLK